MASVTRSQSFSHSRSATVQSLTSGAYAESSTRICAGDSALSDLPAFSRQLLASVRGGQEGRCYMCSRSVRALGVKDHPDRCDGRLPGLGTRRL
eukprot:1251440-Rhodomonas_salina.3